MKYLFHIFESFLIFYISLNSFRPAMASLALPVRPARLLINTFGVQCPQVIPKTVVPAILNLDSLYNIVQDLKNSNECNSVGQMSSILANYSGIFQDYSVKNGEEQSQLKLEKIIAMYTQMLNDSILTPAQTIYVQDQIVKNQTSRVNIKAGLTRFQDFSGRESKGANQLIVSLDTFLSNSFASQNSACYQKNPAQLTNLISTILTSTASFAAPGAALALSAAGVVTSTIGKYVVDFKSRKTMTNLNDSEMPIALRCVSEVLTEQYCSASETIKLINERIDSDNTTSPKFEGINLLSYQLDKLSNWLESVHAGSPITSEGDLVNRQKTKKQGELLVDIKMAIEAYAAQEERNIMNISKDEKRSSTILNDFYFIVTIMSSGSIKGYNIYGANSLPENPLFKAVDIRLMPYAIYRRGEFEAVPYCGPNPCPSLNDYLVYNHKPPLGLSDWHRALENIQELINSSIDAINTVRASTDSVDARSIISGNTNAYDALLKIKRNGIRISKYLSDHKNVNHDYSDQISIINSTVNLAQQVANLIDESSIPRSIPDELAPSDCRREIKLYDFNPQIDDEQLLEKKSFQITACISKILKLDERGSDVFFTKVRNMVSYEMEARFLYKELGDGVNDLINSTKDDLVNTILNSYSSPDSSMSVGQVRGSLEDAQKASQDTLNQFFDFFISDLIKALNDPGINGYAKNDLCFRVLPYLDNTKAHALNNIYAACSNASLQEYKNGPIIRFADYIQKIPRHGLHPEKIITVNSDKISDRYCLYQKYNHANKLIELQKEEIKRNLNLSIQSQKPRRHL
jgi:hypothetical protein